MEKDMFISNTNFSYLPVEIQRKIFKMLPSEVTVATCIPEQALYIDETYAYHINSRQDYSALAAATGVCKYWKELGEDPWLWEGFRLPVDSRVTAEELVKALEMRRFQHIRSIQFLDDNVLGCDEVQYGIQTKLEVLENIPLKIMPRARKLLRTPSEKIKLHTRIKNHGIVNQIPPINPALDLPEA